jgi:small-conductance mechanosensitive channel
MATFSDAITTAAQLHQAETATYLTDAVIGIAFIVIILIVANLISWQPGAYDPSPSKRRRWYYIFGVATLFVNLGVNYFMWMRHITKAQFVSEYTIHMIVAAIVGTIIYMGVTFGICKMQKKDTKLASIF